MRKNMFVMLVALTLLCTVVGNSQTNTHASKSKATKAAAAKKKSLSRSQTEEAKVRAPRRVWLTMTLTSVFDSNIDDDEKGLNSFGLVPSVGLHFQNDAEKPSFEADYEVGFHRYTNNEKYDRLSQNLTASYRRQLSRKWQARTTGEISLKGSSEDRDINNQFVLEQQLQYRFNPSNRLRLFGAYRLKRYPLEDIGKNAVDPYIGARFEQQLKGGRSWEILYRYDKNRSQDPKDRYVRRTFGAQFTTPLLRKRQDLLTIDLRYAPRLYARQVKVDGERVPRQDRRWALDVLYERPLSQDIRWGLNYSFEMRNSNDPEKNFNSHQFSVTFAFNWWR